MNKEVSLYAGVAAGYVAGFLPVYSFPVLVGPIMEAFHLSEEGVGIVFGLEALGIAVASAWLAPRSNRFGLHAILCIGVSVLIVGYGLAISVNSIWLFALGRFIAGVGEGCVVSAANSAGAIAISPERAFAAAQLVASLFTILLLTIIPYLIELWGYRAGIGATLFVLLTAVPILTFLPSRLDRDRSAPERDPRIPHVVLGTLTLTAYALFTIADSGTWVFSERIGTNVGLSAGTIGMLLGATTGIGLLGALLAMVLDLRAGRIIPITSGLGILAVAVFSLSHASSESLYTVSLLPLSFTILFLVPYFLGMLAALDKNGTWTILSATVSSFAIAAGPVLVGVFASRAGFEVVGWFCSSLCLLTLGIMVYVIVMFDREQTTTVRVQKSF